MSAVGELVESIDGSIHGFQLALTGAGLSIYSDHH